MKSKNFALIFTIISLIFAQNTFAARFGGGKSRGMQRSQLNFSPNRNYSQNNRYTQQNNNTQPQTNDNVQPRHGMGAATAAALGAAAGVAGGYMLGKSVANNDNKPIASNGVTQAEQTAPATTNNILAQSENKIPWGIIAILIFLLIIGIMFFKKKSRTEFQNSNNFYNNQPNQNGMFNSPNVNKNNPIGQFNQTQNQEASSGLTNNLVENRYMPDGIETMYFLRQAKGMFLHIQSMNNPENINEVAKYMTPELYNEVKNDIANNTAIADFSMLNCNLISANMEENRLIASVGFNGMVSEDPSQTPQPFNEIWNFVKSDLQTNKWLVAGIQQTGGANA